MTLAETPRVGKINIRLSDNDRGQHGCRHPSVYVTMTGTIATIEDGARTAVSTPTRSWMRTSSGESPDAAQLAPSWCACRIHTTWSGLTASTPAARFLGAAVRSGFNLLASSGTEAGKTARLDRIAAAVPTWEYLLPAQGARARRRSAPPPSSRPGGGGSSTQSHKCRATLDTHRISVGRLPRAGSKDRLWW